MSKNNHKSIIDRGFSLVEVMVALAIVSGLLIVLIVSMNYHLEILSSQKTKIILTNLAKDKLDNLKITKNAEKGEFKEPYKWAQYQTEIKDSMYPGIKELIATVKGRGEEIVISELVTAQSQ